MAGPVACFSYLTAELWHVDRFPLPNRGAGIGHIEPSIAADGPMAAAVPAAPGVPAQVLSNGLGAELRCGQQITACGCGQIGWITVAVAGL